MSSQENINMGNMLNQPASTLAAQNYTEEAMKPVMDNMTTYPAIYPEVYYRLKPYITMVSDLICSAGTDMPTQQQLEAISDEIYDNFCKSNPDMAEYMNKGAEKDDPAGDPPLRGNFMFGFRPSFGFRGFRRRGIGRDFISALLLSELFGRDGYYY